MLPYIANCFHPFINVILLNCHEVRVALFCFSGGAGITNPVEANASIKQDDADVTHTVEVMIDSTHSSSINSTGLMVSRYLEPVRPILV